MPPNKDLHNFQDGNIVKIELQNFMTYDEASIKPGSHLNMILGANGTGKSAIVCSMIIGLAGEVSLTGRGGSPADFVQKGKEFCRTKIELFNSKGQNHVITRKISLIKLPHKVDHKSEWAINGLSVNKKQVKDLMSELKVKVDNLCQFLPQDSVTKFVRMTPSELLLNTLKAVGDDQLVSDHDQLVQLTAKHDDNFKTLKFLKVSCQENETNVQRLEEDVRQLRKRKDMMKEKDLCKQKIEYIKFEEAKEKHSRIKEEYDKICDDLKKIEESCEPHRLAEQKHIDEERRLKGSIESTKSELSKSRRVVDEIQEKLNGKKFECQKEFAKFNEKQTEEARRGESIKVKTQELQTLESKLSTVGNVDYSRQISQIETEMREKKNDMMNFNGLKTKADEEGRYLRGCLEDLKRRRENIMKIREKKNMLLRAKFPDTHRIYECYIKNKHKFENPIFGPIMCEINLKDVTNASTVEHCLNRHDLTTFVCQTENDLKTFTRMVFQECKIRPDVALASERSAEDFRLEYEQQNPRQKLIDQGFQCVVADLIDAPEPVLRYLYGTSNMHRIPVAKEESLDRLNEMISKYPRFIVGNTSYVNSRSHYDKQMVSTSDRIRDAHCLVISLDSRQLKSIENQMNETRQKCESKQLQAADYRKKEDSAKAEWTGLSDKHREFKNKHGERKRIETLIESAKESLKSLMDEKIDLEAERQKLTRSVAKINSDQTVMLGSLTESFREYQQLHERHMSNVLLAACSTRNRELAHKKYLDAQKDTRRQKECRDDIARHMATLKRNLTEAAQNAAEKISGFKENKLDSKTKRAFDSIPERTTEELMHKIVELELRVQRIFRDNRLEAEFERHQSELERKRKQIAALQERLDSIASERSDIKKEWLPKLEEVIRDIDKDYTEFMQKLSYGGRVELSYNKEEPDNFAAYGITILVKYRDDVQLRPLSASCQSGGERSVATMIYMLALQNRTTVPFRCVDEINQGMDQDNERKVFELLVKTADSSSSQYFLVSPKLLANLPYSRKMMIHIVFNGKKLDIDWNDSKEN